MVVVFIRHGEKRRTESDPELTSAGRQMASETGRWLVTQNFIPDLIITTATHRTRQTVEEIGIVLEREIPVEERHLPDLHRDWQDLVERLAARHTPPAVVVCVGHHPTMNMLKRAYPPPVEIPRRHFASAIAIEDGRCVGAWPGRP
ncbi:MAG: histidine phosphatase family protein [Myxococcota bacterium]